MMAPVLESMVNRMAFPNTLMVAEGLAPVVVRKPREVVLVVPTVTVAV